MKSQILGASKLAVIKECSEFVALRPTEGRFTSGSALRLTPETQDDQSNIYDAAFLTRKTQDILKDYESNPFFRARLNYLLKTRNSLSSSSSN
jgi:hypothetical protein